MSRTCPPASRTQGRLGHVLGGAASLLLALAPTLPLEAAETLNALVWCDHTDPALIEPFEKAHDLVNRHATISRMTSSISPVEMTVDPIYALNPDMAQDVSEQHQATLVFECSEDRYIEEVLR